MMLFFLLFVFPSVSLADLYQCRIEDGTVVIQQSPCKISKKNEIEKPKSKEFYEQQAKEKWEKTVNDFIDNALSGEGIDYRNDTERRDLLDKFVKDLAKDTENSNRSMEWFLATAHMLAKDSYEYYQKIKPTHIEQPTANQLPDFDPNYKSNLPSFGDEQNSEYLSTDPNAGLSQDKTGSNTRKDDEIRNKNNFQWMSNIFSILIFAGIIGFFIKIGLFTNIKALRVARGFLGFIFAIQITGLLPALTWMHNIEYITGYMEFIFILKIVVLAISGFLFFWMRHVINKLHHKNTKSIDECLPTKWSL